MRDRPTGAELAELVYRIRDIDPKVEVPDEERYKELMLASALAIAERQTATGDVPEMEESLSLSRILGKGGALVDHNQALVTAIRGGVYDPGELGHDDVREHLWQTARERVWESNPKALLGDEEAADE